MPDHKPWEKPCPYVQLTVLYGNRGKVHHPHCAHCHGTGYVPMTTGEMLEELAGICKTFSPSLYPSQERNEWICIVRLPDTRDFMPFHGPTPDDTLRAALEVVTDA